MSTPYHPLAIKILALYEKVHARVNRDLLELGQLQSQLSGLERFANRGLSMLYKQVALPLSQELTNIQVYCEDINNQVLLLNPSITEARGRIILMQIDSINRFTRAIDPVNFIAVFQEFQKSKIQTTWGLSISTSLTQTDFLYAELNQGVYLNDVIAKCVERTQVNSSIFATNKEAMLDKDFKFSTNLGLLQDIFITGSIGLDCKMLIAKSIDGLIYHKQPAYRLILPYLLGYCNGLLCTPLSPSENDTSLIHSKDESINQPASILIASQILSAKFIKTPQN